MNGQTKAVDRGDGQAASIIDCTTNHNSIPSLVKAAIVSLALYYVLPYRAANWLIQRGGLRDA